MNRKLKTLLLALLVLMAVPSLAGWYTQRQETADGYVYTGKWNFESDRGGWMPSAPTPLPNPF